jgi:hypothetical protein
MQKRKPVWNAPMLNQPTVFEAAHIEYIEINGFAAAYSLPRARIRTQILSPDSTYSSMLSCNPSTPKRAAVIWPFRISPVQPGCDNHLADLHQRMERNAVEPVPASSIMDRL